MLTFLTNLSFIAWILLTAVVVAVAIGRWIGC